MTEPKHLDIDENGKYLSPPPPGTIVYLGVDDTPDIGEIDDLCLACVVIKGYDESLRMVSIVDSNVSQDGIAFYSFEDGFYVTQKSAIMAAAKYDLGYYKERIARVLEVCEKLGITIQPENMP